MRYEPNVDELEYLKALKASNLNPRGQSQGEKHFRLASYPIGVSREMAKRYGTNWYNDEKVLIDFLRKNPQYKLANPSL